MGWGSLFLFSEQMILVVLTLLRRFLSYAVMYRLKLKLCLFFKILYFKKTLTITISVQTFRQSLSKISIPVEKSEFWLRTLTEPSLYLPDKVFTTYWLPTDSVLSQPPIFALIFHLLRSLPIQVKESRSPNRRTWSRTRKKLQNICNSWDINSVREMRRIHFGKLSLFRQTDLYGLALQDIKRGRKYVAKRRMLRILQIPHPSSSLLPCPMD